MKAIDGMRPVRRKDQVIDLNMAINFVVISHSSNFCGSYKIYGCCLTMHISFSFCSTLK